MPHQRHEVATGLEALPCSLPVPEAYRTIQHNSKIIQLTSLATNPQQTQLQQVLVPEPALPSDVLPRLGNMSSRNIRAPPVAHITEQNRLLRSSRQHFNNSPPQVLAYTVTVQIQVMFIAYNRSSVIHSNMSRQHIPHKTSPFGPIPSHC
jgi:hypothetical protein